MTRSATRKRPEMNVARSRCRPASRPSGLGEFDLDPQFDLGQERIKAGIAGGFLQARRRIVQPAHHCRAEIAGEQTELELVEHVERALAPFCRAPATFDRILLDAL